MPLIAVLIKKLGIYDAGYYFPGRLEERRRGERVNGEAKREERRDKRSTREGEWMSGTKGKRTEGRYELHGVIYMVKPHVVRP